MNSELALMIAQARHRVAGDPVDEAAVASAKALDDFRQYLSAKVQLTVRLELLADCKFVLDEDRPTVQFAIDGSNFVLTREFQGCILSSGGASIKIEDEQFEDYLLWAISELMKRDTSTA